MMRVLLVWIFVFGLAALPAMARTNKNETDKDGSAGPAKPSTESLTSTTTESDPSKPHAPANSEPSTSEIEHRQLRELLASQSEELQAARKQLHELQQRMETLETQVRAGSNAQASTDVAAPPPVSEIAPRTAPPTAATQDSANDRAEHDNSSPSGEIRTSALSSAPPQPAAPAVPYGGNPAAAQSAGQEQRSDSIQLANGKVRIGTLLYADYAYYAKTGFGPQFVSQINPPGPGNNGYNAFEINRAYLNVFYSPNDAITFRLTPELYRQVGAAPATKVGKVSAIGANADQELPFRLKYAYMDFNTPLARSVAFKKDVLTIGQQQNPLIEWEERVYGYRYANTVPWDYMGFSAALLGISLHGPIEFQGKEYLDYAIGAFNNASYKQLEQSEKKQVAARLTVYPFGAKSDLDGLGFTSFYNFGYTSVTPDTGVNFPLYRVAALAHYTFKKNAYEIAAEFDAGRNAFTSSNFFSGSAPQDEFGLGTTQFAGFDALAKAIQNVNGAKQKGYVAFGHAQIPRSPFTLFGTYQSTLPNTNVAKNPLDFDRIVAGLSYRFNARLRFALTSQNLLFRHSQFTFPAAQLRLLSPSLAAANPNGITNAVPNRIQAIFADTEFTF